VKISISLVRRLVASGYTQGQLLAILDGLAEELKPSPKSNAERQKQYRERKKAEQAAVGLTGGQG